MSNLKYKEGDRVLIKSIDWYNENKDENGDVLCFYGVHKFTKEMSKFCGKIVTISTNLTGDGEYLIEEDGEIDWWTVDMIEGEEETKSKFNVGDKVITDTNMTGKIIEVVEEGWYRIEFEPYHGIPQPNSVVPEEHISLVEDETKNWADVSISDDPFTVTYGPPSMNDSMNKNNIDNGIIILPEGYIFKDENGKEILTSKIILEKLEPKYPKTFLGCCDVLGIEDTISRGVKGYKSNLLDTFQKLIICRDAYWKIAGDEMGLGKPWKPTMETVYCISRNNNVMKCSYRGGKSNILEFPTPEMRDTFKENFDPDIEICKEFL